MPTRRSPTAWRRRLGIELRQFREDAKLTTEEVAKTLECSVSKISRIETGHVPVAMRDVRDMLDLYKIHDERRDALMQLARQGQGKGWWHQDYGDISIPIIDLVGLEETAAWIHTYQQVLVPGLLQTRDYARAVLGAILPNDPEEVDRRADFRIARQELLEREEDPPALRALLDEAVLRRPIGGPDTMRRQLARLLEAAALPNITIRVVPFVVGEHPCLDGAFTIVGFDDPRASVTYLEHAVKFSYIRDRDGVATYTSMFNELSGKALDTNKSAEILSKAIKEL
jgi:transcriptional regulator with XRE-family HTH domain